MGLYMIHIQNHSTSTWAHISYIYKITVLVDGPIYAIHTNDSTSGWAHISYIYKMTILADGPIYDTYTKLQY